MAKFIQLTEMDTERQLFVNLDELSYFVQQDGYCSLIFKGTMRHVEESAEEILALINANS